MNRQLPLIPIEDSWMTVAPHDQYAVDRAAYNERLAAYKREAADLEQAEAELRAIPNEEFDSAAATRADVLRGRKLDLLRSELALRRELTGLLQKRSKARRATGDKIREAREMMAADIVEQLKRIGFDFDWRGSLPPLMSPAIVQRHPTVRELDEELRALEGQERNGHLRENADDCEAIERELAEFRRRSLALV